MLQMNTIWFFNRICCRLRLILRYLPL